QGDERVAPAALVRELLAHQAGVRGRVPLGRRVAGLGRERARREQRAERQLERDHWSAWRAAGRGVAVPGFLGGGGGELDFTQVRKATSASSRPPAVSASSFCVPAMAGRSTRSCGTMIRDKL